MNNSTCSIGECTGEVLARGWCRKHYRRWQNHGDANHVIRAEKLAKLALPDGRFACSKCGEAKSPDEYHYDKSRDRRYRHCKSCHSLLLREWNEGNAEYKNELRRQWRTNNVDLAREQWRNDSMRRRAALRSVEYDPLVSIEALILRDGSTCAYCGTAVSTGGEWDTKASVDHVVPVSCGGPHTFDNTVVACLPCNTSKNSRTPEEWASGALAYRSTQTP